MTKGTKRKKGFFSISAVAKMFSVHQQTVRLYEKEGLITPKRTEGNTRMFSEEDIEKLEEIIYFTHELGINLAGVQMIHKLQKSIAKLQKQMNATIQEAQKDLQQEVAVSKSIIADKASELIKMKRKSNVPLGLEYQQETSENVDDSGETIEIDTWTVDYDE
ncbi:MerR family transcriptional regulator [bacterium]|jgi:MerR family transcriptional regulator/heat shock protein HspR|nr:MerR family transcriptional regulator [bacterium]MBT5015537.1 MerR family transcriptional regulator [bacterium]